jgi:hypothetical protein
VTGAQDPAPRDPLLVALADDAANAPPEFAADALIRIASSSRMLDIRWRRDLLNEAFMRAYGVREPYRRATTQRIPPDTRQGAQQLAYTAALTRLSLQVRAAQSMAYADAERARELFEWIDLDVTPASCADPLVPAVDEYYSALSRLARTTFPDDRAEAMRFFTFYLWRAHLPSEMPAVAKALETFEPRPEEAPYLEGLYHWILLGGASDARGFSSSALDVVSRTAELHQAYRMRGASSVRMLDAVRPYLVTQLKAPRCSDSVSESQTPAAFNAVIRRLRLEDEVKPIDANSVRPSRMLGAARIDPYWQTADARRLYDGWIRIRGIGNSLPSERVRQTLEWRAQAEKLLTELELWNGRREADERDYLYQKATLFTGLIDLMLPSPERTRAVRSMIDFLSHADDRDRRALWFAFVERLIDQARGSGRGEILRALEDSQHPILSLYARLERFSFANRQRTARAPIALPSCQLRFSRHTPNHGRLPCAPDDSGNAANTRIASGSRSSFAPAFSIDFTSTGVQPCGMKNGGPSAGANRNGAPAWLAASPARSFNISSAPGDIRSRTQW